jgi:glutamate synthase domain-containing protein 3
MIPVTRTEVEYEKIEKGGVAFVLTKTRQFVNDIHAKEFEVESIIESHELAVLESALTATKIEVEEKLAKIEIIK